MTSSVTARKSGIYRGWVRHRRHAPRRHVFRKSLFMLYLDLEEVNDVFLGRWLWASERRAPASYRRQDHLGDPAIPLERAVRDLVEEHTGRRPAGAVRLLTHLRYWGLIFNPIKLYYCFGEVSADRRELLEAVVAEVHNTPWGEVHTYVLSWPPGAPRGTYPARQEKTFHVSPFLPMDLAYDWRITAPGEDLLVHIAALSEGEPGPRFEATLHLERQEISGANLASAFLRHPWMTASVVASIYFQAARLWWKRIPFYPHPGARR
ncbi:MAG: DUF1365 domain-containing protein [Acidobacteria bacterium]|nr:DUF1365 domain-containing protein [Acidobacteriota bacterium]